jgi:hypothetical protein
MVARRMQRVLPVATAAYMLGFLASVGDHNFWHSHGDLLTVVIGGLVALAALHIGISVIALARRSI